MSLENERHYLYREAITNPHGSQKSPWHVVVTSVFPNRVGVTNPNGKLSARADIDELIKSPEITLIRNSHETITLPPDVIGRLVEVIDFSPVSEPLAEVNPFET